MKLFYLISLLLFSVSCTLLDPNDSGNLVPRTVTEDSLLPSIVINGTMLHAETMGDISNPILIFLHGGPGMDYQAFICEKGMENASRYPNERVITNGGLSELQNNFFCVFFDQRGAGLSPRFDKGAVTFDMYLEDLDSIIDYYKTAQINAGEAPTPVYLFGWSYGGRIATAYVNKYPTIVEDIILYEPAPFSKDVYDYYKEQTKSVFAQVGKKWLDEHLMSLEHITPDSHARADYRALLGCFRDSPEFHEDPNTPVWRYGRYVGSDFNNENSDITSNLENFNGRALFLAGELTLNSFPDYMKMEMEYYQNNSMVIIPGVGHTGVWEKADDIVSAVQTFL